jgi:nucleoside-diphosphate-sugar epimerase
VEMTDPPAVVVLGATGFVGTAVCAALHARGAQVVPRRAPRLGPVDEKRVSSAAVDHAELVNELAQEIRSATAVVNAAGLADSGHGDVGAMMAANGALPSVLASACRVAGVRLVHVSSAAVQGRSALLDESPRVAPFSVYSASKAAGERAVLEMGGDAVVYRPPGVHAAHRSVTRAIGRVARSRLSSTTAPGNDNTAQALLGNVADAVAFLALTELDVPHIVAHPSEDLTTAELLTLLGGHRPRLLPQPVTKAVVATATAAGRMSPRVAANARRLEMLWLGQDQGMSWLTQAGWKPPISRSGWEQIGSILRSESNEVERQ